MLLNSNPATIMTDKDIADRVYIEPLTVEVVEQLILKEKPDSVLPTLGRTGRTEPWLWSWMRMDSLKETTYV